MGNAIGAAECVHLMPVSPFVAGDILEKLERQQSTSGPRMLAILCVISGREMISAVTKYPDDGHSYKLPSPAERHDKPSWCDQKLEERQPLPFAFIFSGSIKVKGPINPWCGTFPIRSV